MKREKQDTCRYDERPNKRRRTHNGRTAFNTEDLQRHGSWPFPGQQFQYTPTSSPGIAVLHCHDLTALSCPSFVSHPCRRHTDAITSLRVHPTSPDGPSSGRRVFDDDLPLPSSFKQSGDQVISSPVSQGYSPTPTSPSSPPFWVPTVHEASPISGIHANESSAFPLGFSPLHHPQPPSSSTFASVALQPVTPENALSGPSSNVVHTALSGPLSENHYAQSPASPALPEALPMWSRHYSGGPPSAGGDVGANASGTGEYAWGVSGAVANDLEAGSLLGGVLHSFPTVPQRFERDTGTAQEPNTPFGLDGHHPASLLAVAPGRDVTMFDYQGPFASGSPTSGLYSMLSLADPEVTSSSTSPLRVRPLCREVSLRADPRRINHAAMMHIPHHRDIAMLGPFASWSGTGHDGRKEDDRHAAVSCSVRPTGSLHLRNVHQISTGEEQFTQSTDPVTELPFNK